MRRERSRDNCDRTAGYLSTILEEFAPITRRAEACQAEPRPSILRVLTTSLLELAVVEPGAVYLLFYYT